MRSPLFPLSGGIYDVLGRLTKYFFVISGTFPLSNDFRNSDRLSSLIFRIWFCETPDEIDCFMLYSQTGYSLNFTMLIWALHPFFLDPCRYTFFAGMGFGLLMIKSSLFTEAEWSIVKRNDVITDLKLMLPAELWPALCTLLFMYSV